MKTYVARIGGKSVLIFRAGDDDQAQAIIDDHKGSMRSDLQVLVGTDRKPLWDGKATIQVREATAAQHAEWEQSRDQAISDGEIDTWMPATIRMSGMEFSEATPLLKRLFCLVGHWEELPRGLAGCSQLLDLPEDIR
jgi:hypothetical protein